MEMFSDLIGLTERDKVCAEIWRFKRELYKRLCSIIDDDEITDKTSVLNECLTEFYVITRQAVSSWSKGKVSGIRFEPTPKQKNVKLVKKYFTNAPIWHIIKYSPDQPRDENGRWTDSGGSALGRNAPPKGFVSRQKEKYHYNKHVIKENAKIYQGMSQKDYTAHAKNFLSQPCEGDIDGYITEDGAICRFNKTTGEYAKGYPNGIIKTCMIAKCNSKTGEAKLNIAQKYFDDKKNAEGMNDEEN